MSEFEVRVLSDRFPELRQMVDDDLKRAVAGVAIELQTRVVRSVQERSPSDGAVMRYGPRRVVNPAAKGFPPNTDTGNLVNSVQVEPGTAALRQEMVVGANYAGFLEFGGWPFVTPAVDTIERDLDGLLSGILRGLR
jgi:hypothetical protein